MTASRLKCPVGILFSNVTLALQQAGTASAEFRIERIKQVAAMKDRSGDYCDWRYLCEVVRVADVGSEVHALLCPRPPRP